MSIFDDCLAIVFVADHIGVDAGGKLNVLGAGFSIAGVQPNGFTAAQSVAAVIDVPAKYRGQEFPISLELRDDETDAAVQMPDPSGQPQAFRIQQLVKAEPPSVPNVYIPDSAPCRVQVMLAFPTGFPLQQGRFYSWRLEVEGQTRPGWQAKFYVVGPPPQAVWGGPSSAPSGLPQA